MKLTGFYIKNQCHLYNSLLKKTQSNYFSFLLKNCSDSKSLWRQSIKQVFHRSSSFSLNPPSILSTDQISSFFVDKIKALCLKLSLVDLNPFSIPERPPSTFSLFQPASVVKVSRSPPKLSSGSSRFGTSETRHLYCYKKFHALYIIKH